MLKKLQALKAKKGFTLVELIVVIAIIGVLAAILIPTLSGVIESSRKRSVESTCSQIHSLAATFASAYLANEGEDYPNAAWADSAPKTNMETKDDGTEKLSLKGYVESQIPELKGTDKDKHKVEIEFADGKPSKVSYTYGKYTAKWTANGGQEKATKVKANS